MYKNEKYLIGKVVDIADPNKLGRIRCEVLGHTEGLDVESLPWYLPMNNNKDVFDLPKLEEYVYIRLWNRDIHLGMWKFRTFSDEFAEVLTDDDYQSAKILLRRTLDEWETEGDDIGGLLTLYYTLTDGFMMQLKESKINIQRNSHIHLFCEKLGKQIHITEDQISLGKLDKSDQPAVLGDDNVKQHELNIAYCVKICDDVKAAFDELSSTASGNPYTAPLGPIFTKHSSTISSDSTSCEKDCTDQLPETLSELVSLDKAISD